MPFLNKDTKLCISIASNPSNIGTRFHNFLYQELDLDFVYKAFAPTDLAGTIAGVRALGIRGCSVSMPFKEDIIDLVDELSPSALAIQSINTVVNDNGTLLASNTDFEAVLTLVQNSQLDLNSSILIRGSGGMAKAVAAAFKAAGFTQATLTARNVERGNALSQLLNFEFLNEQESFSHSKSFDVLVNVTPIGMQGTYSQEMAFPISLIEQATTVLDAVALPARTPFMDTAAQLGKVCITGSEIIALQAALQFKTYTGVELKPDQIQRASEFARMETTLSK